MVYWWVTRFVVKTNKHIRILYDLSAPNKLYFKWYFCSANSIHLTNLFVFDVFWIGCGSCALYGSIVLNQETMSSHCSRSMFKSIEFIREKSCTHCAALNTQHTWKMFSDKCSMPCNYVWLSNRSEPTFDQNAFNWFHLASIQRMQVPPPKTTTIRMSETAFVSWQYCAEHLARSYSLNLITID